MLRKATFLGLACASILGGLALGQTTVRVSVDSLGVQANNTCSFPVITPDARYVAFQSLATNLAPGDTNATYDVFVHDRQAGTTTRASVDSSGVGANDYSGGAVLTSDGRCVAFTSYATNLVAGDTNANFDVFVRDLVAGTTIRASLDPSGAEFGTAFSSNAPSISADGRYVAFVIVDTTQVNTAALCVRDLVAGTTTYVNLDPSGTRVDGLYSTPSISADGRYVAFASDVSTLVAGDSNGDWDVFVRELATSTTLLASVDPLGGPSAGGPSGDPSLSSDGSFLLFDSVASNLVLGDTNGHFDVFMRALMSGTTERVSLDSSGGQANGYSFVASGWASSSMASDGPAHVVFFSGATNLVPGDTNGFNDLFVRDRIRGVTIRANLEASGAQTVDYTDSPTLATDMGGRYLALSSDDPNLVAGDTNGVADIFVRDFEPAEVSMLCFGDGTGAACPCGNSGAPNRGCENSSSTGGCVLAANGVASLGADTLHLTSFGERSSALSVFMQGDALVGALDFGDGLRCVGGTMKRLYAHRASSGVVTAPQGADLSVSARSAALGDVISAGTTRYYQVQYRDPVATFCPIPTGDHWNVSMALSAHWYP